MSWNPELSIGDSAHWLDFWRLEGGYFLVAIVASSLTVEQVYVAGVIYFGMNAALASISAFLPTIVFSQFTPPIPSYPAHPDAYLSKRCGSVTHSSDLRCCHGRIAFLLLLLRLKTNPGYP